MNHRLDRQMHSACEKAFATEIAITLRHVLARQPSLGAEEKQALLSQLFFAVCAHLSGSSFAGRVQGKEIYPVLGFSVGEEDDAVYFGSASMHEQAPRVLEGLDQGNT